MSTCVDFIKKSIFIQMKKLYGVNSVMCVNLANQIMYEYGSQVHMMNANVPNVFNIDSKH
jgi:hypothetical protein